MKQSRNWSRCDRLCFAIGFALLPALTWAQPSYEITEVPIPPGHDSSMLRAINNAGDIILLGTWDANRETRSFLWADGVLTPLGEFGEGFVRHEASDINESGQISGSSWAGGFPAAAWQWEDGVFTPLGSLGGANTASFRINEAGQQAGWSNVPLPASIFIWISYIWDDGVMTNLGTLPQSTVSDATSINDSGQTVGISVPIGSGFFHAVIADTTIGMHSLGTLGGLESRSSDINNAGQVVGRSHTGERTDEGWWLYHAFLWEDGVMIDLGTLPGDNISTAYRINQAGVPVGGSWFGFINSVSRAVLWHEGVAVDLNTRIPPDSGWVLNFATGITDDGRIIGRGMLNGEPRGYLLTPVP